MRIAVNTRLLLKDRLDGIGWYAFQTLRRVVRDHPSDEFYFLFDRPYAKDFIFSSNVKPIVIPPPTRHPLLWHIWFEYSLPLVFRRINPDLFLSPDGYLSLRSKVPSVAVIHDINFHHRPGDLPPASRRFYTHYFPLYAKKADRILTVSEYSRHDISESYGIPLNKIDMAWNGAHEIYQPLGESEKNAVKAKYSGGESYFIFVGSLHPRKNVERLLQAFETFKTQTRSSMHLLLVGAEFFHTGSIQRIYEQSAFREHIRFTGRMEPEELSRVLGAAFAMVFVPLFEGFGIPLVEAMYCDVPVIASEVTSLPEVAGDAALYCDPMDVNSIASAMQEMSTNTALREKLVYEGRSRRMAFSWEYSAMKLWDCMMRAYESSGHVPRVSEMDKENQ